MVEAGRRSEFDARQAQEITRDACDKLSRTQQCFGVSM
jgi:hypothetical protein